MIAYLFLIGWQFGLNSKVAGNLFIFVWWPIFYALLLIFRVLIYCDVSEKNKILRQELTKLKIKSAD